MQSITWANIAQVMRRVPTTVLFVTPNRRKINRLSNIKLRQTALGSPIGGGLGWQLMDNRPFPQSGIYF